MTDKQILDEVYFNLRDMNMMHINTEVAQIRMSEKLNDLLAFVEEEWQKRDDEELRNEYNRNRPPEEHIKYPEIPTYLDDTED